MVEQHPDRNAALAAELLANAYVKIGELETALVSARRIGAAVGILMARRRLTYEAAFELLSVSSQRLNSKVRDLAEVVLLTGDLPGRE